MDLTQVIIHHLADAPLFQWNGWVVSKHRLMVLLGAGVITALLLTAAHGRGPLARGLRSVLEALVDFIWRDMARPALGERGRRFMPWFLTLFLFILVLNLIGLVPGGAAATGNISVTAALSLTTLGLVHLSGLREHGVVHHFKNLVPPGTPVVMVPFLFVLELMGYATRTLALCVRLFANMTAGHLVILLFMGLILLAGQAGARVGLAVSPFIVLVTLGLYLLEMVVAFVQAYVFTMLTAIFVGATVHPDH